MNQTKDLPRQMSRSSSGFKSSSSPFKKQTEISMLQTQHSSSSEPYSYDDDELGFEESCLMKLKEQRRNIEELTYLYQKSSQQLKGEEEKCRRLELQLSNLDELKEVKMKWLALRKEFEQVSQEKCLMEEENLKLKQKLSQLSRQQQMLVKRSSEQLAMAKQELLNQANHYEQLLKDKDDEIRYNLNVYETKEHDHAQTVKQLNEIIRGLKEEIKEIQRNTTAEIDQLTSELMKRDQGIEKLKMNVDNVKEENAMLRRQLKELEGQFCQKEREWLEAQDELVFEINNLNRKLADSENRLAQVKYESNKLSSKLTETTQLGQNLKHQLKLLQEQSTITIDQLTHSYQQKICAYKHQTQELKESVQQLLEVKDIFNKENEQLKDRISKEDEKRKKRNLMMRNELREISKIQNSVKRVV